LAHILPLNPDWPQKVLDLKYHIVVFLSKVLRTESNMGRLCWVINGTICQGAIQGSWAKKM